jgi:tRNA pseudouridine synthase 9
MREIIRYLPLSNPRFQLLAYLSLHIRDRKVPMETIISELPALESIPPPSRSSSPKQTAASTAAPQKLRGLAQKRQQHSNVAKHVNAPPDPLYYFEDGLRKVHPYYFTYNTFCKERWRGKTLLEIFLKEFRDRPEEYYVRSPPHPQLDNCHIDRSAQRGAIAAGTVCVSGTDKGGALSVPRTGIDTIVNNGDMISHTMHRHEPPVTDKPIGVVYEDDSIVAISKPAGVPVHPTGRYNHNSVTEIMRYESKGAFNPLRMYIPEWWRGVTRLISETACNRLDRLTSGLMFIAKTRGAADRFMEQLKSRTIRKQYVARVRGEFPE